MRIGKILYFAYGTNLNIQQMNKRCPNNKIVSDKAILKNYCIDNYYKGFVSIKPNKDDIVNGII